MCKTKIHGTRAPGSEIGYIPQIGLVGVHFWNYWVGAALFTGFAQLGGCRFGTMVDL